MFFFPGRFYHPYTDPLCLTLENNSFRRVQWFHNNLPWHGCKVWKSAEARSHSDATQVNCPWRSKTRFLEVGFMLVAGALGTCQSPGLLAPTSTAASCQGVFSNQRDACWSCSKCASVLGTQTQCWQGVESWSTMRQCDVAPARLAGFYGGTSFLAKCFAASLSRECAPFLCASELPQPSQIQFGTFDHFAKTSCDLSISSTMTSFQSWFGLYFALNV